MTKILEHMIFIHLLIPPKSFCLERLLVGLIPACEFGECLSCLNQIIILQTFGYDQNRGQLKICGHSWTNKHEKTLKGGKKWMDGLGTSGLGQPWGSEFPRFSYCLPYIPGFDPADRSFQPGVTNRHRQKRCT